ncbi:MAG TPA: Hsp20/alpha crystallin family protein [Thermoanaerobaculia bacterium]
MTFMIRRNQNFFEPFFRFPFFDEAAQQSAAVWSPAVDVAEEKERILVKVEVPGMEEKDLRISFEDGMLTVSGERQFERKDDRSYHRIERSYGSFTRAFTLPRSVDPSKIVANYRNGVLEIEIPKKEESRPRQISINVNQQQIAE